MTSRKMMLTAGKLATWELPSPRLRPVKILVARGRKPNPGWGRSRGGAGSRPQIGSEVPTASQDLLSSSPSLAFISFSG